MESEQEKVSASPKAGARALAKPQILMAVIALLFLAVVVLAALLIKQTVARDEAAAIVNGEAIGKEELFAAMYAAGGKDALDQLIAKKLIAQEAAQKGFAVTDEELEAEIGSIVDESFGGSHESFLSALELYGLTEDAFRGDARLNLLARKLAMAEIDTSEEEARRFFEENLSLFAQPEEVEVRHILVETREQAAEIITRLNEGGDFAALAAEFSIDVSNKDNAGYLGFFSRGTMVQAFEEAAFALQIGEVSAPVETDYGFHVIEMLNRKEEVEVKYEDVSEAVKEAMIENMIPQVINGLVQTLFESAEIEYLVE